MTLPRPDFAIDLSRVADPVGTIIEVHDRRFTAIAVDPRKVTWRSSSSICGGSYETTSPRARVTELVTRCEQHRAGRRPAAAAE